MIAISQLYMSGVGYYNYNSYHSYYSNHVYVYYVQDTKRSVFGVVILR